MTTDATLAMLWWAHARWSTTRGVSLTKLSAAERLQSALLEIMELAVLSQRPPEQVASFVAEALHDMGDNRDESKSHSDWLNDIGAGVLMLSWPVEGNPISRAEFIHWFFVHAMASTEES